LKEERKLPLVAYTLVQVLFSKVNFHTYRRTNSIPESIRIW